MPGSQRHAVGQLGDPLRPLVHAEVGADAVAGAVVVVEAGGPQRRAGQGVEGRAGGAGREAHAGQRQVALQHQGEALAHLGGRLADGDRAGDVGRAVQVLGAGIDQQQRAGLQLLRPAAGSAGSARWRRWRRRRRWCRTTGPSARRSPRGSPPACAPPRARPAGRSGLRSLTQCRKRLSAAPSRMCAWRAPSISTAFLRARGRAVGILRAHDLRAGVAQAPRSTRPTTAPGRPARGGP